MCVCFLGSLNRKIVKFDRDKWDSFVPLVYFDITVMHAMQCYLFVVGFFLYCTQPRLMPIFTNHLFALCAKFLNLLPLL